MSSCDAMETSAPATKQPPSPVMSAEDVSVLYRGRPALRNVNLLIPRHRITALIGPSGCGKTSFLNTLNRLTDLVDGCEVRGSVLLEGRSIRDAQVDVIDLRRQVGMIFQKPAPFPLSIRRNLELPLREHGVRKKTDLQERLEIVLRDVGLWDEVKDRLNSPAMALSGGQQQRLCMARALALRPDVLLMDEPCSALDPLSSGLVEELIKQLRRQYTIVIVTHNLAQARRLADDVAVFWTIDGVGQLIEHRPTAELFRDPRHEMTRAYVQGLKG